MPASKSQQKAVSKYMKQNYDEIKIRVKKGRKAIIQEYAETNGESMNSFIDRAITETMERDGANTEKWRIKGLPETEIVIWQAFSNNL